MDGEVDAALEEDFWVWGGGHGFGESGEESRVGGLAGSIARILGGVDRADEEDCHGDAGGEASQGEAGSYR